jgi:hypothetical protein
MSKDKLINMDNISPEQILREKELASGFVYDDPIMDQNEIGESSESINRTLQQPIVDESPKIGESVKTDNIETPITSMGKAQSVSPAFDSGWKNVPVTILPSGGLFYPDGTRIAIRAAEVREIRHFSTIDEDDRLDIEEKLSYVLERCLRMDFPGEGVVSYLDIKQEDRFFLILAIRDLTFVKGENSIILKTNKKCKETPECPFNDGIELRTGVLGSYDIDPKVMSYYNSETRSFIFDVKKINKVMEMTVPSIGVSNKISEFVIKSGIKGLDIDEGFLKIAPFIFKEWRELTIDSIKIKMRESDYWTKEEYSLYYELSDKIRIGTNLEVKQKCPVCGDEEVTADINFPSGLRSLFVISDIFGELL